LFEAEIRRVGVLAHRPDRSMMAAGRPARWGQRGVAWIIGVTACARALQSLEVFRPQALLGRAQLIKVWPRKDSARMPVGEHRLHRVVADRFEPRDRDVALADLQCFLAGTMAFDFGRWRK